MKNVLMIINPSAGKLKSKTALFDMLSEFCKAGYQVITQITQYKGHATELAKNAKLRKTSLIVCCGGDGTLNEVITGIMQSGSNIPLGYIPTGSTNDFASSIGIPLTPKKAARNIVDGKNTFIDIGIFNDRYFSYIASFGAFTSVSYTAPQSTKNVLGHTAYVLEGIKDLASIHPIKVKYKAFDVTKHGEYVFGCVANTLSIGGMLKLGEDVVNMNDGLFEVLLVKVPKTPAELHKEIWGLINSDFSDDVFEFFKTDEIEFELSDGVNWSLDGEFAKGEEKIKINAIKDAVILKTSASKKTDI